MIGLIKKDILVIAKNFKIVPMLVLIPTLLIAIGSNTFFMPIMSIVIPMMLSAQLSLTMNQDELSHWRKNVTAMPISAKVEAGSKYILHFCLATLSTILLFGAGSIMSGLGRIGLDEVIAYSLLGFIYASFYGIIIIPASYKYGTSSSRYVFMLFVFIPSSIPVILSMLQITLDLSWLMNINKMIRSVSVISISTLIGIGFISFFISVNILKKCPYKT